MNLTAAQIAAFATVPVRAELGVVRLAPTRMVIADAVVQNVLDIVDPTVATIRSPRNVDFLLNTPHADAASLYAGEVAWFFCGTTRVWNRCTAL